MIRLNKTTSLCLLAAALFPGVLNAVPSAARAQIVVQPLAMQTPAGPVHGFMAVVNLADPRLHILVTHPLPAHYFSATRPSKADASLVAVDKWARNNDLCLAINANYFGWTPGGGALIGLVVSDGVTVSPARSWKGQPDPSLLILKDADAFVARIAGPGQPAIDSAAVRYAVSGVGGSASDTLPGTLLVQAGRNCGSTARVASEQRLARSAAGVDESGHRLTLIAIDGRQPQWSVGISLHDLADLLIHAGVRDAINLDGGGSTSFVYRLHPTDPWTTNRPCDESAAGKPGVFRPVAAQLGFRIGSPTSQP
jgi:hypothetical protein